MYPQNEGVHWRWGEHEDALAGLLEGESDPREERWLTPPYLRRGVVGKAVGAEKRICSGGEEEAIKSEAGVTREQARRVLQAAAVEAFGRAGAYVTRDPVMRRAGVPNLEEFWAIASYLDEKGWIAEADDDYGIFIVTAAGVEEATS